MHIVTIILLFQTQKWYQTHQFHWSSHQPMHITLKANTISIALSFTTTLISIHLCQFKTIYYCNHESKNHIADQYHEPKYYILLMHKHQWKRLRESNRKIVYTQWEAKQVHNCSIIDTSVSDIWIVHRVLGRCWAAFDSLLLKVN